METSAVVGQSAAQHRLAIEKASYTIGPNPLILLASGLEVCTMRDLRNQFLSGKRFGITLMDRNGLCCYNSLPGASTIENTHPSRPAEKVPHVLARHLSSKGGDTDQQTSSKIGDTSG
jgi:hypothetical protein